MRWHWAVPGPLAQYTGGYRYDAEVVSGLRARGVALDVHALAGRHPDADGSAQVAAAHTWTGSAAAGAGLIIDGLALPAFAPLLARSDPRGPVIALIHHPLALETGLDPDRARHLAQTEHAALSRVFDRARERLVELIGSDRFPAAMKELMRQALSALGEEGDLEVTRDDRELCRTLATQMGLSAAIRGEGKGHGKMIAVSRDGLRAVENSVMKRLGRAGEERVHDVAKILFEDSGGGE